MLESSKNPASARSHQNGVGKIESRLRKASDLDNRESVAIIDLENSEE